MAGGDKVPKRARHRLHLGDPQLKVADMGVGDALDLPARTATVAPQRQEFADFGN